MKENFAYSDYTMNCYSIEFDSIESWNKAWLGEIAVWLKDGSVMHIPESYVDSFIEWYNG